MPIVPVALNVRGKPLCTRHVNWGRLIVKLSVLLIGNGSNHHAEIEQALRAGGFEPDITVTDKLSPVAHLQNFELILSDNSAGDRLDRHPALQTVATLPQVVFELDRRGVFTYCNQYGLDLLGYTSEDLKAGVHVSTVIEEADRGRAVERVMSILQGDTPSSGAEYTVVRSDGSHFPVIIYSIPVIEEGVIVGMRGIVVDLSHIKGTQERLAASEERYRQLVETMGDGLISVGPGGGILFVNQAMATILGYEPEEVQGRDIHEFCISEDHHTLDAHLESRFSRGERSSYEITLLGRERTVPVLVTASPMRDCDDRIFASLAVVTDISRQRAANRQLLHIKTALDNASEAISIFDADLVPVYINPAFEELSGLSLEEFIEAGGPSACLAGEEDFEPVQRAVAEDGFFIGEFEGRHSSGRQFPVMGRIDAVHDPDGELTGFVAVITDITERREREERLRITNARLSLINRLHQRLTDGASVDEIIAAGADGILDVLGGHHAHVSIRQPGRGQQEVDELAIRYSNMPAELEARAFGAPLRDRDAVLPLHAGGVLARMYTTGEMTEIREDELGDVAEELQRWVQPGAPAGEVPITEALGVRYLCLMPLTDEGGTIGHITLSRAEDRPLTVAERELLSAVAQQMAMILNRARSEEQLARLNNYLQAIVNNVQAWFMVADGNDEVVIWNRAAERISGYSREQIKSANHLMRLLYPDEEARREAHQIIDAVLEGETSEPLETTITRADGAEARMTWHLQRVMIDGDAQGLVVLGHDVTRSHELQEQLQRVQRMDAVGTLAGGIAHDFNNVLTAIIGHADLLAMEADPESTIPWHAEQINKNAHRAARLTRQLLAFSRRQPAKPQLTSLSRLIDDMTEMLRRITPENIDLRLDLDPELGYTQIDPSQVEQVVMNLLINAREAMPDGGVLCVSTCNETLAEDELSELFDARPGDYVVIEVTDTGVGMAPEVETHIFEPFFTTRGGNGGTGLGLSTVYGIVRQNNGEITVHTESGEGSVFRVYLPRADSAHKTERGDDSEDRQALHGSETILLVEDADSLRELIRTILDSFGYRVLAASRGDEGLELARAHDGEIGLLVSDVVMPEMSGTDLADQLLEIMPAVQVLLISGYPSQRAITVGHTDERIHFLQKPFSAMELARMIRSILNGKG